MKTLISKPGLKTALVGGAALAVFLVACAPQKAADVPSEPPSAAPQETRLSSAEHAEKGLALAKAHYPGLGSLCDTSMTFRNVNRLKTDAPAASSSGTSTRQRSSTQRSGTTRQGSAIRQAIPPTQVFDNLYFVGNSSVSAYLYGDESGYILIDSMRTADDVKNHILPGLDHFNIDRSKIKYLLITHAHGDHYGGHRAVLDALDVELVMSDVDWELSRKLFDHPRFGPAPTEGKSVSDGDVLKVGNTAMPISVRTGHTKGTISPIFPVYENGKTHYIGMWGGTGFNFGVDEAQLRRYAASAKDMKEEAAAIGVDVFLSNHSARDGAREKLLALQTRKAGEPNPFVEGKTAQVPYDIFYHCASAQAERLASGQYKE